MDQIMFVVVHFIIGISIILYPSISKRDVVFGIKVPTAALKDEEIVKLKRNYVVITSLFALAMIVIQMIIGSVDSMIFMIFGSLVLYFLIYLVSYKKMKEIKKEKNWSSSNKTVIDTSFRQKALTIHPRWYLVYVLVFVISLVVIMINYDNLPELLNTRVDNLGQVSGQMPKDNALMYLLGIQASIYLLLIFVQYTIKSAKQDISSQDASASVERSVKFRYMVSLIIYVLGLMIGLVFFMTLLFVMGIITDVKLFVVFTLVSTFIPVLILLYLSFKFIKNDNNLRFVSFTCSSYFL